MGGKKGAQTTADNLYSQDILELVAGIGQGTIYGLEKGLKSFYIGGIPFKSETGDLNFQDVCVSFRHGYYDDQPIGYVMGGEGAIMKDSVGVTLPGEIARNFITPSSHRGKIKQIDVRFLVSALYAGDAKGNTRTTSLIMEIKYRKVGAKDWNRVTETTASLYASKSKLDTLKQEASIRGLNYETMSDSEKISFANEVLTETKIITSGNDLIKKYIPALKAGGYYHNGLTGLATRQASMFRLNRISEEQLSDVKEILDAYNSGALRIEGKTTSGYIYEVSIPIFDADTDDHDWEIEVTRLTKELSTNQKRYSGKTISLESLTLLTSNEKVYRKTALCQVVAQHSDRFDNIPDFSGDFYGLMCDIPSNYNPFEHTYDEANNYWDGTYKKGWTNNPFWVLRELIMNVDWGLRSVERRIQINNANFYALAKFCDEKVPTLDGKTAPRYTFNEVVQQKQKIKDYINYVAGSVHATLREINGVYHAFMDKPTPIAFFVTPEMIIQTNFQYAFADLESKYNSVKVSFLNKDANYEQDHRTVLDNESINKYGLIPYEFQAIGCTNLTEAVRQAVYCLLTNRDEDLFVNFNIPRLGHLANMYDHFYLAHKENGWGNHARILDFDIATRKINLRDGVFESDYSVIFHTPYGIETVKAKSLDPYTLQIVSNSEDLEYLIPDCPIIISGGIYGEPKIFRILSIMQDDSTGQSGGEVFAFKAALVSPEKFTSVDNINDSKSFNLTFNASDNIYKNKVVPTTPENVRLRFLDWASYNGQLVYQLDFTANVEAHHYDVTWLDEVTGEKREKRLFSKGGELFPAFSLDTKKVSLYITPFNAKGESSGTKYVRDIVPYLQESTKLPILQSITPQRGYISVQWSAETSDMFDYTRKYFSYETPKETVSNIVLKPTDINFKVPDHGPGDYSFQLTYDQDGSGSKLPSEVWQYTSTTVTSYIQPSLTDISSSKTGSSSVSAPTNYAYAKVNVTVTDWKTNPDLANTDNPFSVRRETAIGSNNFEFINDKFYSTRFNDTKAQIVLTDPSLIGVKLQIRTQNTWGTTISAWSEITVPKIT